MIYPKNYRLYRYRKRVYGSFVQGYSPFAVARYFIEKAATTNAELTPMKLIKLVYIAHGWHLAFFDEALIREPIEAWKYGPVIESLYHALKCYGNARIPENAIPPIQSNFAENTKDLLEKVWAKYSPLSAVQLSALTHQPGTPWYQASNGGNLEDKNIVIPDENIKAFYKQKIQVKAGSGH